MTRSGFGPNKTNLFMGLTVDWAVLFSLPKIRGEK